MLQKRCRGSKVVQVLDVFPIFVCRWVQITSTSTHVFSEHSSSKTRQQCITIWLCYSFMYNRGNCLVSVEFVFRVVVSSLVALCASTLPLQCRLVNVVVQITHVFREHNSSNTHMSRMHQN